MAGPENQYCASCIGTLSFTSDYKHNTLIIVLLCIYIVTAVLLECVAGRPVIG